MKQPACEEWKEHSGSPSDSLSLKWGDARQIRVFKADTTVVAFWGDKAKGERPDIPALAER